MKKSLVLFCLFWEKFLWRVGSDWIPEVLPAEQTWWASSRRDSMTVKQAKFKLHSEANCCLNFYKHLFHNLNISTIDIGSLFKMTKYHDHLNMSMYLGCTLSIDHKPVSGDRRWRSAAPSAALVASAPLVPPTAVATNIALGQLLCLHDQHQHHDHHLFRSSPSSSHCPHHKYILVNVNFKIINQYQNQPQHSQH